LAPLGKKGAEGAGAGAKAENYFFQKF